MIHGYGFPRWRGGPMKAADSVGLLQLRSDLRAFDTADTVIWRPVEMLDGMILNGQGFGVLNT
jgi:3-hydroxyacyl-CoA dehydrogenase